MVKNIVEVITNLNDFIGKEENETTELLQALKQDGLPCDFSCVGVEIQQDEMTCNVFLTNHKGQICMLADGELVSWNTVTDEDYFSELWHTELLFNSGVFSY